MVEGIRKFEENGLFTETNVCSGILHIFTEKMIIYKPHL